MSTSISFPGMPIGAETTRAIPSRKQQKIEIANRGFRYRTLGEQIHQIVCGCWHDFTWPHRTLRTHKGTQIAYPKGFNSYQSCTKCGVERFYNDEVWRPGPVFVLTRSKSI